MTQAPATTEARRQVIRLPLGASSNNIYSNRKDGRGRCKSARYRRWLVQADLMLMTQWRGIKKISGPVSVTVRIPAKSRGDADNRIKVCCDFLVSMGITDDDRNYTRVTVERAALPAGECEVVVERA